MKESTLNQLELEAIFYRCIVQGIYVGSGDPVRVLRLLHNKYAGYN